LGALQELHNIGLLHNDLKLENILVGDQHGSNLSSIKLIDFGLCSTFIDEKGRHIKPHKSSFRGNVAFCSYNALNDKALSRRDDLISLAYLLLYLHRGTLNFLGIDQMTA
jgi:serine/threonine protein kinase